jgi:hypothetical protein
MAAYYQVVRLLEEKFDGLELNHIARRSNEATNELAKLASGRALGSTSIFANDLYKPLDTYLGSMQDGSKLPTPALGAGSTPAPLDPEVMQIEDDPATGPDPLSDWRIPYLECLVHGALPTNKIGA